MAGTGAKIASAVGGVVLLLGVIVLGIYLTDTPIGANVIDTDCSIAGQSEVTIKTKFPIPGITRSVETSSGNCNTVAGLGADGSGAFVKYYPKSERTIVYDNDPNNGGRVVFDTG